MLVRTGHGYEKSPQGRCTAFDGILVIANPLGGRDEVSRQRRTYPSKDGPGTTYASFVISLGRIENTYYLLMHHGGGREVWDLHPMFEHCVSTILKMDEREQYALLYSLWRGFQTAREQAQRQTAAEWYSASVEGKIRKRRNKGDIKIYLETDVEQRLRLSANALKG